jgi:hypothetical protein
MNIWSEVTGVSSHVVDCTVDEAEKTAPGGLGREAAESTASSAEFGMGKVFGIAKGCKSAANKLYNRLMQA